MPDLTDSFCERCGARHVVSPNAPRALSFKRARVLATGLKYFVLTDGQSMRDSLTLARHEDEHQDTNRATESFHRIFNFCMTCRQYACDRCWNSNASACLSCAPETGIEPVAPEDHLIVRTPVARWDADWSQFPDGPAVEPLARPAAPVPHGAPLPFAEAQPLRRIRWPGPRRICRQPLRLRRLATTASATTRPSRLPTQRPGACGRLPMRLRPR